VERDRPAVDVDPDQYAVRARGEERVPVERPRRVLARVVEELQPPDRGPAAVHLGGALEGRARDPRVAREGRGPGDVRARSVGHRERDVRQRDEHPGAVRPAPAAPGVGAAEAEAVLADLGAAEDDLRGHAISQQNESPAWLPDWKLTVPAATQTPMPIVCATGVRTGVLQLKSNSNHLEVLVLK